MGLFKPKSEWAFAAVALSALAAVRVALGHEGVEELLIIGMALFSRAVSDILHAIQESHI